MQIKAVNRIFCVLFIGAFLWLAMPISLNAQMEAGGSFKPASKFSMEIKKIGPYIGYDRGKYNFFELGGEFRWKQIKLKNSMTHGLHTGFGYNFWDNVLSYSAGYWIRPQRLGLTYGLDALYRTNFSISRPGFAPVLGYQFLWLHLQTGYAFLLPRSTSIAANTFFIRLRFTIINQRDFDLNVKNKKGKSLFKK